MKLRKAALLLTFFVMFIIVGQSALAEYSRESQQLARVFEQNQVVSVQDIGLNTRFQDLFGGNHKRGRANIAADFNLDGNLDFYIGNPGDLSFVLKFRQGGNRFGYQISQKLIEGGLGWGAVSFDYDNDGDYDLFVPTGANEGVGHDFFFRNLFVETGQLRFIDVTDQAGVSGPIPPGETDPIPVASANAVVADYDQDGDDDLFVNVNIHWSEQGPETPEDYDALSTDSSALYADCSIGGGEPSSFNPILGRNILWENNGNGTFTDVTDSVGLGITREKTRHSTFFDFDNDGDMDLFENNFYGPKVLYKNLLQETGIAEFVDVTEEMSNLPNVDLSYPKRSFASAAADFNNDGWEDIMFFLRGPASGQSPYAQGHVIYINQGGTGFVNVAPASGVNEDYVIQNGVMGCMVGDVNGDGTPDVYVGNGGPSFGVSDRFFLSSSGDPLIYQNATALIDFPAPERPGMSYPTYPYRTHGTTFVDVDNDGILEVVVVNGGPAHQPSFVREPNRMFKFDWDQPYNYLKVRPVGDGITVAKDAIGTRIAVTVSEGGANTRTIYRTLFGGSCFSAQNGFEVHFGLGQSDTVQQVQITWPDGSEELITDGLNINQRMVIEK